MASATDVLSLALAVRRACDDTCAAKKLLAVVARKMDSLRPVVSKIESTSGASASAGGDDVRRTLAELHDEITRTMQIASKAKKMSKVVFVVKASGIREKIETNLKSIHLTLMTLTATRNEQLASELQTFHSEWRRRQDELRLEAERERTERTRLVENMPSSSPSSAAAAAATSINGDAFSAATGIDLARVDELERALADLKLERDGIGEALRAERDDVQRDKMAAEAQLMGQIAAVLEDAERSERRVRVHRNDETRNTSSAGLGLTDDCICPLSAEVMTDPVIVDAVCLHTANRPALQTWIDDGNTTCPVCGTELRSKHMSPNVPLRNIIASLRTALPAPAAAPSSYSPYVPPSSDAPRPPSTFHASAASSSSSPAYASTSTTRPPSDQMASLSLGSASTAPANRRRERDEYCGVTGEYDGEVNNNGQRHGRGIFSWDDGDVYDGEWRNGEMHGRGTFTSASGDVYDGDWKDGKQEGRGRYKYANGEVYDGDWRDGKKEGRGRYKYADGEVYDGDWKEDKKEGRGRYTTANGDVYDGDFRDGKQEGRGTYTWADEEVDVKQYRAGNVVGEGARWSADRRMACRLLDGEQQELISLTEAVAIARRLGVPVPP